MVAVLCELALAARRLGCTVRLVDPDPAVADLVRLAGVHDVLLGPAWPGDGSREAPRAAGAACGGAYDDAGDR